MDIMIDCETWGLAPGAVIRSVALVAFNPQGTDVATGNPFTYEMYANMHEPVTPYLAPLPAQQLGAIPPQAPAPTLPGEVKNVANIRGHNFHHLPSTVEFWGKPENREAELLLTKNREPVEMVLGRIRMFFDMLKPEAVWSHGPVADIVWLEYYFRAYGFEIPWHFRTVRDTRTIYDVAALERDIVFNSPAFADRTFVKHYALDAARLQAYCVQAANWSIREWKNAFAYAERQRAAEPAAVSKKD